LVLTTTAVPVAVAGVAEVVALALLAVDAAALCVVLVPTGA
jgi:hypothetical protein